MIMMEKLDTLRGKPEELKDMKSVRQLVDDLTRANGLLWLAGTAAFLASGMFVVKYFVGGDLTPALWTGEQWINAMLGLLLTLVVTFGQGMLYASGYKGPAALIATCVVVFFGLFSEVSQSMEREDATVRHRSENSPVFQAALGSIGKLATQAAAPSPAQHGLAVAQGEVRRWEAEQQKKARCHTCSEFSTRTIGSNLAQAQGRVATAREQLAMVQAGNASALTGAIAQAKTLEYDEDKHYGMIRLLKSLFGIEGIFASFLFSMVVIGTFEYIFHFIGTYVGNHRKALQLLGLNADGSLFDPPPPLASLPVPASTSGLADMSVDKRTGTVASAAAVQSALQPMPGMSPADPFARDRLRMDYSTSNPSYPMPGFAPSASALVGSLSAVTGKGAANNPTLTGKVGEGGEVQVAESVYLTLCKLVMEGQLRPSRPVIKKALQKMRIGQNQVERQAIADAVLRRMEEGRVVYRNPSYTGSNCGLSEFFPVLGSQPELLALAG